MSDTALMQLTPPDKRRLVAGSACFKKFKLLPRADGLDQALLLFNLESGGSVLTIAIWKTHPAILRRSWRSEQRISIDEALKLADDVAIPEFEKLSQEFRTNAK